MSDKYSYRTFHSEGPLHRNILLWTLEEKGITFRDYDLSTTGIRAKNDRADKAIEKEMSK